MAAANHKPELTDNVVRSLEPKERPYEITDTQRKRLILRVEPSGTKTWWLHLWTPDDAPKRQRYRWKIGDTSTYRLYRNTPNRATDRARSIRDVAEDIIARSRQFDLREEKRYAVAAQNAEKVATLGNFIDHVYLDHYREEGYARPKQTIEGLIRAFPEMMQMRLGAITHLTIRRWQTEALKTVTAMALMMVVNPLAFALAGLWMSCRL